jgi:hypothetical protein
MARRRSNASDGGGGGGGGAAGDSGMGIVNESTINQWLSLQATETDALSKMLIAQSPNVTPAPSQTDASLPMVVESINGMDVTTIDGGGGGGGAAAAAGSGAGDGVGGGGAAAGGVEGEDLPADVVSPEQVKAEERPIQTIGTEELKHHLITQSQAKPCNHRYAHP